MNKQTLTGFIQKYSLGNNIESVEWNCNTKILSSAFVAEDKTLMGSVVLKDFDFEDCKVGIYTTSQLMRMISVLGDDITLSLNKVEDKCTSIKLNDSDTKVDFILADPDVIPKVPTLKDLPKFSTLIKIDNNFINQFIKSKNALSDVDYFTIVDKGTPQLIIGYSSINSNRISYDIIVKESSNLDHISFSSDYFKEILLANKDISDGLLEISPDGIARITFSNSEYKTVYYLIEKQIN
jgi:hypothetical protein